MSKNEVVTFDFSNMTVYGEKTVLDKAQTSEVMRYAEACAEDMTKNQIAMCYGLLLLHEHGNVKECGFANLYDYGKKCLGMGKGTVSEALKIAKRFRENENVYKIGEKWEKYSKSVLLTLAKSGLDDEAIEALEIPENAKYFDVVEKINASKAIEAKPENGSESEPEAEAKPENGSESEPEAEVKKEYSVMTVKQSEIPNYLREAIQKYIRAQKENPLEVILEVKPE